MALEAATAMVMILWHQLEATFAVSFFETAVAENHLTCGRPITSRPLTLVREPLFITIAVYTVLVPWVVAMVITLGIPAHPDFTTRKAVLILSGDDLSAPMSEAFVPRHALGVRHCVTPTATITSIVRTCRHHVLAMRGNWC